MGDRSVPPELVAEAGPLDATKWRGRIGQVLVAACYLRSVLNAARISSEKSRGCSQAAK
jgi:hypothetical protein